MILSRIGVEFYKNIQKIGLDLNPSINCIIGENGAGKTNFVDAIHFLCLTKSAFGASDSQCVSFESNYFRIEGRFISEQDLTSILEVELGFSAETKKIFKCDGLSYNRLSEHIGKLPLVMLSPDDTDIIRDGSEIRRKFFDGIISQTDQDYLQNLLVYNHLLKQRNAALKLENPNVSLIHIYAEKMGAIAQHLANKRFSFLKEFEPIFKEKYQFISSGKEISTINYESDALELNFPLNFANNVNKDLLAQRTTSGIHLDDFDFLIDSKSVKKVASQGQKKSFVIALKLAQFEILKKSTKKVPILIMDDIFDKLDELRMGKLISLVSNNTFGQVFLTDARPERSREVFKEFKDKVSFFDFPIIE